MPIYEYQCGSCQHEFEALQKMSDDPLAKCPECHKETLRKKISAAGFRLAGGGWYETDFKKSGNKKNLAGSESSSSTGTSKSGGDSKASETKASSSATSKSD